MPGLPISTLGGEPVAHRRVAFLFLVLLSVGPLGGLTGCETRELVVSVQPDSRVFTLFVGLLAGGYGERAAQLNPTQDAVLKALGDLPSADRQAWEALVATSAPVAPAPEYALTDQVLAGGTAPGFDGVNDGVLQTSLRSLWTSHGQTIYAGTQEAQTALTAMMLSTAQDTVEQVLTYARLKERPFDSLQVIPNPLAVVGFSRSWLDPSTRTAYVVLGPQDDLTLGLARETFWLCLNSSLFERLDAATLDPFAGILSMSRQQPFEQDRCGTVPDFLRENLARACALKALPTSPEDVDAALTAEWDRGFTLVQGFYAALGAIFEAADGALPQAAGQLVSALGPNSIATAMTAALPPEGYPNLPQGWQWTPWTNDQGDYWYEAIGGRLERPQSPIDGWVSSTVLGPAGSLCFGLLFIARSSEKIEAVVLILDSTSPPIEWGRDIAVSQGDPLPWLEGQRVSIYLPPAVRREGPERMTEFIDWLLGD
jgi:hypothetical protein